MTANVATDRDADLRLDGVSAYGAGGQGDRGHGRGPRIHDSIVFVGLPCCVQ